MSRGTSPIILAEEDMKKWLVLSILGVFILVGFSWLWRYGTAAIEGRVGAREQIQSKETIIGAYTHFFDLKAAIDALTPAIEAQQEQLGLVSSTESKERILANIAGMKAQRARLIAQYNADAQKGYTIGQFKDWSLPNHIDGGDN